MDRLDALVRMGAPLRDDLRFEFPTADAAVDTAKGILFIVCDPEPDLMDWAGIVGLIKGIGFDNGTWPHGQDPGEPGYDPLACVYTWRLEYVRAECVMCDGHGRSGGCALCGAVVRDE